MIKAYRKGLELLGEMQNVSREPSEFSLWWLGQSGFLVKSENRTMVIDPYLSDSLTLKYADTDKPHVRMTERCIDPDAMGFVDLVLTTHGHTDHFDTLTIRSIANAAGRKKPLDVVVPKSLLLRARSSLRGAEAKLMAIDAGESFDLDFLNVSAVPASHVNIDRDSKGHCLYLGYILRFSSGIVIYHSGDTVWNDEILPYLSSVDPDVALLPINGNKLIRGVPGNFNGKEAAEWADRIGAKLAIPHHFEMFEFNTDTPSLFVKRCTELGVDAQVLRCGEKWSCSTNVKGMS